MGEILIDPPTTWSRMAGEVTTWVKNGHDQAGSLRMAFVELDGDTPALDAAVQLGRQAGWGTPLNLGEDDCEHGRVAFVTFYEGAAHDVRLWLVVREGHPAVVFTWIGQDTKVGDEAEMIVLRTLGLLARPPSYFGDV